MNKPITTTDSNVLAETLRRLRIGKPNATVTEAYLTLRAVKAERKVERLKKIIHDLYEKAF